MLGREGRRDRVGKDARLGFRVALAYRAVPTEASMMARHDKLVAIWFDRAEGLGPLHAIPVTR